MPRRNHGRVIFVVERCGSEVDKPDLWVKKDAPLWDSANGDGLGGGDSPVVCECLVLGVPQKDVLRFEICVN